MTTLPSPPGEAARRLARALDVTPTVGEWLSRRGYDDSEATRRFLEPKLSHLSDPGAMADRAAAADRLAHAIRAGERIAVFGDYDCDGITSTAIMTEVLRELGGEVVPLLASRFEGGYGLTGTAAGRVEATSAKVLVTCDCGSSDHPALESLAKRGVDSVVIDHHLVPEAPLPAVAFLNPHRPECGFPYKGLASCGLALSVGAALRAALDKKLDLRRWLDLVAIGTIADVAPLDGDNRALVRAGLVALRTPERPGLRALAELAKLEPGVPLGARDVAFRIAPRLNAPGRLGAPDLALELLLSRSGDAARGLAALVEGQSSRRKELQEVMTAEATLEIEKEGYAERPAIIVGREGWSTGIVGIVAGRLAERFDRPVVVVGFENGYGRGSVRGPKGVRLHDALRQCEGLLERFGGHQAAAGLEVRVANLPELREAFEHAALATGRHAPDAAGSELLWLDAADDPEKVVRDLERLEPCGQGNPAPRFIASGALLSARAVRGGHLKLELAVGRRTVGGFGIGLGGRAAELSGTVTVTGELRRDTFRGGGAVEIRIETVVS